MNAYLMRPSVCNLISHKLASGLVITLHMEVFAYFPEASTFLVIIISGYLAIGSSITPLSAFDHNIHTFLLLVVSVK